MIGIPAGMQGEAPKARRELRRAEMSKFGADIPWLHDPTLVPEAATRYSGPDYNAFHSMGHWMIRQFAAWSQSVHPRLDFADAFNKRDLSGPQRIAVREHFQKYSENAFGPGIGAMAEIFSAIPLVASREGVGPEGWAEIASKARQFGTEIARDGTNAQVLLRLYLKGGAYTFLGSEPYELEKLKLDETTGITTVTPISDLMGAAEQAAGRHLTIEDHSGVCVALQTQLEEFDGASMFDVVWDAYTVASETHIFPHLTVDSLTIPPQGTVEPSLDTLFNGIAHQQLFNLAELGMSLEYLNQIE